MQVYIIVRKSIILTYPETNVQTMMHRVLKSFFHCWTALFYLLKIECFFKIPYYYLRWFLWLYVLHVFFKLFFIVECFFIPNWQRLRRSGRGIQVTHTDLDIYRGEPVNQTTVRLLCNPIYEYVGVFINPITFTVSLIRHLN